MANQTDHTKQLFYEKEDLIRNNDGTTVRVMRLLEDTLQLRV